MTPGDRRKRMFAESRPTIRFVREDDMRWLWAADRLRGGNEEDQEAFYVSAARYLSDFDVVYILEDRNRAFSDGTGPVGIVMCYRDHWIVEPNVEWFPWARGYNKLRCTVAFLMKLRGSREVGCIRVHADDRSASFYRKLSRYCPLHRAGTIPGGRPVGADHIFYLRGKRRWAASSARSSAIARRAPPGSPSDGPETSLSEGLAAVH